MAGSAWREEGEGLVFRAETGRPLHATVAVKQFKALLRRADLPNIRFHDLRHSCASLLAYMGIHQSITQAVLGHSTARLTMDLYTHVDPSALRQAADRMEALLGGRR